MRTSALPLALFLALASSVSAQTAVTVLNELNSLTLIVPVASVASCTPFLAAFGACPNNAATITNCVCTPAFVAALTTCTTSMTAQLTLQGNVQAALPATSLADVTTVCALVAGTTTSLTAGIRPLTSLTSVAPLVGVTVTPIPSALSFPTGSPTSTSGASSTSSLPSDPGAAFPSVVYSTVSFARAEFPTQTKSATVFAAANHVRAGGLVVVGAMMAMMV